MNLDTVTERAFDAAAWEAHVKDVGLGAAESQLNAIKSDLRDQRRLKAAQPSSETSEWLDRQARFEVVINRRLREVRAEMHSAGNPSRRLRTRITELTNLVADLARAIDGTSLEHLLDDYRIPLGEKRPTIAEALDFGMLDGKAGWDG